MYLLKSGRRLLLQDETQERFHILQWREIDAVEFLAEKGKLRPETSSYLDPDNLGDTT